MPHVSKNKVKRKIFLAMSERLLEAVVKAASRQRGQSLIAELLTPTERVMLAKRLAMIVMIRRGYSFYRIAKTLKVSFSTVARFYARVQSGQYAYLANLLETKAHPSSSLERLLRFGLPPRVGKGRWSALYKSVSR